ncbi:helix-turn-helix and ligand-binding sensor domain-containing protein [Hwangdonia lutea]|uniref:Triple tyrosine motif-containing protein n=1 Tax=Hwangdonia lutea TaxID=3075823 RepID=A0AA97EKM8_9FLAO|nr:triple tyrosine motif-containing protein [Hwangdonia sp. SCSIO 19198]WOD42786.1 triple tyrosine motif-containing protein [Hwangdonia sp. SCSIO 19198]
MCSFILVAQEMPPIDIYTPKSYGAENQNWSIAQSKDKYIYVGNNKGLLEFNGANWRLYPSPNETIIRSVSVFDDVIYTGCSKEFGYWQRNKFGDLFYTSLSQKLQIEFLEEEEFWNIINLDEYILFQSLERIYIYNKNDATYSVIESETTIYKMFKVNGSIYFQQTKNGLYKIENGKSKLISNHAVLKNNLLVSVFNHKEKLLIETENKGFYILDNNKLEQWDIPAYKLVPESGVYRSAKLRDGSFVLGTRSNGIFHLTEDGEIIYHINIINGLSNNTIHAIFEDAENNIWLALDNGINCINIKSPFRIHNDKEGKIGTVYASAVYKDYLYLGTNQGLYFKSFNSDDEFEFIEGTQGPVRCLVELNDTLFCGHDTGTFIIDKNNADLVVDIQGTWNIIPINNSKNLLLQGNYDGLNVIANVNGKWVLRNKIEGFDISSKFFEIYNNNIFVSHESKGIYRLKVDEDFTKATEVIKDSTIGKGLNSSVIRYNDAIFYAYKKGVFRYHPEEAQFVKDSVLNGLYSQDEYTSGKLISDRKNNILWSFSKKNLSYVSPGKLSSVQKVKKISLSTALPKGLTGYENISYLQNNKHLIGTSTGYLVLDLDKLKEKEYSVSINSITKSDLKDSLQVVNKHIDGSFKNKNNSIEFTYSVAEFNKYLDTEYQYQLKGIYPEWSNWSANSSVLFKNLPYGDYVFNVRAKVGNTATNNTATYSFTIGRPWVLSNVAIAIYVFLFLLITLLMHNLYKRHYRKQQAKLMQKAARDLELKELENQQQLMRFNNEKLRQDIESKNRELGISTMSLIKKNEFLNNLKKELKSVSENDKNLKSVIRIIDKNLNNTDDWHVFEEAFNNADKDFLKKIKAIHPSLTSNDLRLCAYLRLNLSSKEIAPLLNISPRSVEVKRYRLRKKMDLPRESSLTNYILEI